MCLRASISSWKVVLSFSRSSSTAWDGAAPTLSALRREAVPPPRALRSATSFLSLSTSFSAAWLLLACCAVETCSSLFSLSTSACHCD